MGILFYVVSALILKNVEIQRLSFNVLYMFNISLLYLYPICTQWNKFTGTHGLFNDSVRSSDYVA